MQEKPDKNTKPRDRIDAQVPIHETLAELRGRLLRWFEINGREFPWRAPSVTTYQYVVAELLLQRTRAETVASFFSKFIKEFASWKQLESTSATKLQHHLKPVGLWRRRTASLQALSRAMVKRKREIPKKTRGDRSVAGHWAVYCKLRIAVLLRNFPSLCLISTWPACSRECSARENWQIFVTTRIFKNWLKTLLTVTSHYS